MNPRTLARVDPTQSIAIIETDLRELARAVLSEVHGPGWLEEAFDSDAIGELRGRLEEERKRRAPVAVPEDLLSYTHIYELRKMIEKEWALFAPSLGERREFSVFIDKVEDYRNAPAHSRELLAHERSLLEGIAGDIRSRVTKYRSTRAPDASYYPVVEWVRDSFGNTNDGTSMLGMLDTELRLRPGVVLTFDCRGWDPQGREITWRVSQVPGFTDFREDVPTVTGTTASLEWTVAEQDVGMNFYLHVSMRSSGPYHRLGSYDQDVSFHYIVDPPAVT